MDRTRINKTAVKIFFGIICWILFGVYVANVYAGEMSVGYTAIAKEGSSECRQTTINKGKSKQVKVSASQKKWYKKVGVVYQNPDYQLFMPTVEKEIKFGAKSDEYADEIAEKFGVKHLYVRHPQSLSEGQKRRVSIAAVVATAPEVLILDEPMNGLDKDGVQDMRRYLLHLKEQGKTILLASFLLSSFLL